jgi:hypothetical protein
MSAPENLQAFPAAYCVGPSDDMYPPEPGMTLRDWFAGQALNGWLSSDAIAGCINSVAETQKMSVEAAYANAAYSYADAMLAERKKGGAS